ncbi:hypothetical protein [Collimonas antrihumi]|nr:hypothetical protein [Collimonas antrihumi]
MQLPVLRQRPAQLEPGLEEWPVVASLVVLPEELLLKRHFGHPLFYIR